MSVNRSALAKELATAVDDENGRKAVDNMKKRAITSAKSYDEFKALVACANLKPLSKGDSLHQLSARGATRPKLKRNAEQCDAGAVEEPTGNATQLFQLQKARTPADFGRVWRRLKHNPAEAFEGLVQLSAAVGLHAIFKVELSGDTLSEIVTCCERAVCGDAGAASPAAAVGAMSILTQLPRSGRFDMALEMMTGAELRKVAAVVSAAQQTGGDADDWAAVAQAFKLPQSHHPAERAAPPHPVA